MPRPTVSPEIASAADAADSPLRVFIHYRQGLQRSAEFLQAKLEAAGFAPVNLVEIDFAVERRHVRFYHSGDLGGAEEVAALVSTDRVRDFTAYEPSPSPGLVEIWLEDQ